jgi:glycosyltransferase involved in cell wall biosynthesis
MISRPDIRLLQLLIGEPHGGAERFFVKLAIALKDAGIQQKLVIKSDAARIRDLASHGCDVVGLPFGSGLSDLSARWQLRRIAREFRPTIAMAWMNRAARRMPSGPFIRVARFGGYYPVRFYRRFDWIVCNTPDLMRHIESGGWPPERARMISNFGELPTAAPVKRRDLDTPDDAFVMLAGGRLDPTKGFDLAIRTLADIPGAILWLAGAGDEDSALRGLAQSLGFSDRVRFLGWRDDQAALLAACDVCVVPSRHEPLSNVIIEAWSQTVPVVATASEGPSWLLADGRGGLLVPVDDGKAFADAVNQLRLDPELRKRVAAQGHAKWQQSFSREMVVDAYIRFFQEAASERNGPTAGPR